MRHRCSYNTRYERKKGILMPKSRINWKKRYDELKIRNNKLLDESLYWQRQYQNIVNTIDDIKSLCKIHKFVVKSEILKVCEKVFNQEVNKNETITTE